MEEASTKLEFEQCRQVPRPAVRRSRTSPPTSRSTPTASRRPTCSRPRRTAARPASRCSSSAPARTGATAPTSRRADRSLPVEEVLDSFIAQFYDDKPVPRLILLSHDVPNRELLAEALSTKAERKIEIRVPQRGTKTGIGRARARERARGAGPQACRELLAAHAARRRSPSGFGLGRRRGASRCSTTATSRAPTRWAAMIVAGPDGSIKSQYRKFNIKSDEPRTRRRLRHDARGADAPLHAGWRPRTEATASHASRSKEQRLFARRRLERRGGTSLRVAAATEPVQRARAEPTRRGDDARSSRSARPRADRRRRRPARGRARGASRSRHCTTSALIGVAKGPDRDAGREHFHLAGRDRPIMLEPRDPCSTSCSACATRRTASPSARIAPSARRRIGANPLDEIAGIGPHAPARAARSTSARPRPCRAPASRT